MSNESLSYVDTLKSRFCKQYFPRLKSFIENFNISEEINDKGFRVFHDSLGMHFLLKWYGKKENTKDIDDLKMNCHWQIDKVNDLDVIKAVEEFFYITSSRFSDSVNSIDTKRNTLLQNLFKLGLEHNVQSNIGDLIMSDIAEYFGIKFDEILGNLYRPFVRLTKECKKKSSQECDFEPFSNALRLFSNVRNGVTHPDHFYFGEQLNLYHQFILFTYIAYVYVCRRIWTALNNKSFQDDKGRIFKLSVRASNFKFKPDDVELIINKEGHTIEKIELLQGHETKLINTKGDEGPYYCKIFKYQKYTLTISIKDSTPILVEDLLDYNSWFKSYKATLPGNLEYSYKDDNEFSNGMKKMIAEVEKAIKGCINNEIKEAIGHEFSLMQPLLNNMKENNSEKIEEAITNIMNKIIDVSKENGQVKDQIEVIHQQIRSLHETCLGRLDEMSDNLYELKKKNEIIIEKLDKIYYLLKKRNKIIIEVILLGTLLYLLYDSVKNLVEFLQCPIFASLKILIAFSLTAFLFLFYKEYKLSRIIAKFGKAKVFISLFILCLTVLIGSYYGVKQGRVFYAKGYDFMGSNSVQNAKVAKLMENILDSDPSDNNEIRILLAKYYLSHSGSSRQALKAVEPLLSDIGKHSQIIFAFAQILYEAKQYTMVWTLIEYCKKNFTESDPNMECLEGIMLAWGQGCTKNVQMGLTKLINAQNKGNIESKFYLGRFFVNDLTEWESPNGNIPISDMDLARGAKYLQLFAAHRPDAALELGNLYADLNMTDSAEFYYKYAINMARDSLLLEAKYRLALLYESQGDSTRLLETILANYQPAVLHYAIDNQDHKRIISLYKDAGEYVGCRYIPPITNEYIAVGQLDKALEILKETRPNGNFNAEFVKGMELIACSDTTKRNNEMGYEYIKDSANKGCMFAQMMYLYNVLYNKCINLNFKIPSELLKVLDNYGKEIPFAYVLEANLLRQESNYNEAYIAALKATSHGQPAGALELSTTPPESDNEDYMKIIKSELSKCYWFLHLKQIGLRKSPAKDDCLTLGYEIDTRIYELKGEDYPLWKLAFWSDVSMANNHMDMEFLLLNKWVQYENDSQERLKYKKKLMNSIFGNEENFKKFNQDMKGLLITALNDMPKSYKDSLTNDCKNEIMMEILKSTDNHSYKKDAFGNVNNRVLSHKGPYSFEEMILELSDVIGIDYFKLPFDIKKKAK